MCFIYITGPKEDTDKSMLFEVMMKDTVWSREGRLTGRERGDDSLLYGTFTLYVSYCM